MYTKYNKIGQSNLETGHITTPGDRPTHNCRTVIQSYLPDGTMTI